MVWSVQTTLTTMAGECGVTNNYKYGLLLINKNQFYPMLQKGNFPSIIKLRPISTRRFESRLARHLTVELADLIDLIPTANFDIKNTIRMAMNRLVGLVP